MSDPKALTVALLLLLMVACAPGVADNDNAAYLEDARSTLGRFTIFLERQAWGGIPTQLDMARLREIQTDWEALQPEEPYLDAHRTIAVAIFFAVRAVELAIEDDIDSSRINLEITAAFMAEAAGAITDD